MNNFIEKSRRWLHRGLCMVVMGNVFVAYRQYDMGNVLEAIYFMLGAMVTLMMVNMAEDDDG